jgi:hypothetical protein
MALPLYWWWYGTPSDKSTPVLSSFRFSFSNKQKIKAEEKVGVDNTSKISQNSYIPFSTISTISKNHTTNVDNLQNVGISQSINISNLSGLVSSQEINVDNQGIQIYTVLKDNTLTFDFLSKVIPPLTTNFSHFAQITKTGQHPLDNIQKTGKTDIFTQSQTQGIAQTQNINWAAQNTLNIANTFNIAQRCIIFKESPFALANLQKVGRTNDLSLTPFSSALTNYLLNIDSRMGVSFSQRLNLEWGGLVILYNIESNHEFVFDWWLRPDSADWWWIIPDRNTQWTIPTRIIEWNVRRT